MTNVICKVVFYRCGPTEIAVRVFSDGRPAELRDYPHLSESTHTVIDGYPAMTLYPELWEYAESRQENIPRYPHEIFKEVPYGTPALTHTRPSDRVHASNTAAQNGGQDG